jgi:O-acetyl-ADP-ribose deacetylase (regulator of RNase III)
MISVFHRFPLKRIELVFAKGDLLAAGLDAVVNSEQTDFILSRDRNSLSGQIQERCGALVQDELDQQTSGETLGPGVVLATTGGCIAKRIYHAGFHEPYSWPGLSFGLDDADYLQAIARCVSQALHLAGTDGIDSIGFPLIGCGLFGLSAGMLVRQFIAELERADTDDSVQVPAAIWLIIRDEDQWDLVLKTLIEMLFEGRKQRSPLNIRNVGVSVLDQFRLRIQAAQDDEWASWLLCRYCEVGVQLMLSGLASSRGKDCSPTKLFDAGRAVTFGAAKDRAQKILKAGSIDDVHRWPGLFSDVLSSTPSLQALAVVNDLRNDLAHGRHHKAPSEIYTTVEKALSLDKWSPVSAAAGDIPASDWIPWTAMEAPHSGHIGLFDRWSPNRLRYLVPSSGHVFELPFSG